MGRVAPFVVCFAWTSALPAAAAPQATERPGISVTGLGEVRLPPDVAVLRFGVASRASTAAAAAVESARRTRAISDTLRAWGLAPEILEPVALVVSTNETAADGRLVDYEARTVVGVRLRQIERLGALVDAALAAGATTVPTVQFESDTADRAERQGVAQAYHDAERTANALVTAAGRRLGDILDLRVEPNYRREFGDLEFADYPGGTSRVVQREVVVTARITVRWRIEPSR